jgi:selenocysteine lyase/cysteine desulfurase
LSFVEEYLVKVKEIYANTHTKDNYFGMQTNKLYIDAKNHIREMIKANEDYAIISVGSGTTGAIHRLTQILGIYEAPATRLNYARNSLYYSSDKPVIFVSRYEHHSNLLPWKEGNTEVVEIDLDGNGMLNLRDLEEKINSSKYNSRIKIGAFSAASNVTGICLPINDITSIVHRASGLIFFDFATSAPYVDIEMINENDYIDGIYFSPHKFIGGPGSSGILVLRKALYKGLISPTCAGGGTVQYVSSSNYDFVDNIEEREDAGTPPILQTIRAAIALEIKAKVGCKQIKKKESEYIQTAFKRLLSNENIQIIGPKTSTNRLGIVSFNIKYKDHYLHPRFVSTLLNDLFGIQGRAGCSCAGPYGHYLLNIGDEESELYRRAISQGDKFVKPGWVRVNFHYLMDSNTYDYTIKAIQFIADYGYLFLQEYRMDFESGRWIHKEERCSVESFSIQDVISSERYKFKRHNPLKNKKLYKKYIKDAYKLKRILEKKRFKYELYFQGELKELFWYEASNNMSHSNLAVNI